MSFETLFLGFFENISKVDFNFVIQIVLLTFGVFWLVIVGWIVFDARERSNSRLFIAISAFLVLVFNIPGLIVYLIIRPKQSLSEQYWADLEKRYLLYETADLFDCGNCGFPLQPGFLNCPNCGETVKVKCECGATIDKHWKYCPVCGKKSTYIKQEVAAPMFNASDTTVSVKDKKRFSGEVNTRFNNLKEKLQSKLNVIKENRKRIAQEKKAAKEAAKKAQPVVVKSEKKSKKAKSKKKK